jgi:hypothetical protein
MSDNGSDVPNTTRRMYRRPRPDGDNEWYTAKVYIEAARRVLGTIDIDPASCEFAQRRVKAAKFFTKEDDGLAQQWNGNVWLNPPFSPHTLLMRFVSKLADEIRAGHVSAAILLSPSYTDSRWFAVACAALPTACFTTGRIRFEKADGRVGSPACGQVFHYYGPRIPLFRKVFGQFGWFNLRADTGGELHPLVTDSVTDNRSCAHCGLALNGQHKGALFHSSACRQAAYRSRASRRSKTMNAGA